MIGALVQTTFTVFFALTFEKNHYNQTKELNVKDLSLDINSAVAVIVFTRSGGQQGCTTATC